jgi:hypothetical protein
MLSPKRHRYAIAFRQDTGSEIRIQPVCHPGTQEMIIWDEMPVHVFEHIIETRNPHEVKIIRID